MTQSLNNYRQQYNRLVEIRYMAKNKIMSKIRIKVNLRLILAALLRLYRTKSHTFGVRLK